MTPTPVPLLDLKRQVAALRGELDAALAATLDSCGFILGPTVKAFEEQAAAYLGANHAWGVASGTDALWLALRALDVGPGDVVLTSPFTFFATASAACNAGARMLFADIEPQSYNLDPAKVREALEGNSPVAQRLGIRPEQIKAIIPVHLYGQPVDMPAFEAISTEYGVPLVEDACQAMGADYAGKKIGNSDQLVCFSFFPSKNLGAFGDGGLVSTNHAERAERVRLLRAHGSDKKYHNTWLGMNSRLDALQAGILGVKLPHLDRWVDLRREHAAAYDEAFAALPGITPAFRVPDRKHAFHQYTIRVADGRREALAEALAARKIGHAIYYPIPLHLQGALGDAGFGAGDYPLTEAACAEVLSLPIFPEMTAEERGHVISALTEFAGA